MPRKKKGSGFTNSKKKKLDAVSNAARRDEQGLPTTVAKAKRTVGDDGSSCCLNCTKMLAQDKFKDDYVQTCVDCCDRRVQNYKRRKLAHAGRT